MSPQDFLAHFHEIANAPGGVARLREVTYSLAVRGHLISNDPAESALPLGTTILSAGSRPIADNEKHLDDVPPNWTWARFEWLGEIFGGQTPSMSKSEFWGGDIPWVSPKDMRAKVIRGAEMHITSKALDQTSLKVVPPGSIVFVTRSGILRRTLPVAVTEVECVVNQDLKVLMPHEPKLTPYLIVLLRGFEALILSELVKTGTTVQSVIFDAFRNKAFPLPPLAEQKRIVAKVEELMALCDALEAQQQERARLLPRLSRATHTRLTDSPTQPHLDSLFTDLASVSPEDMRRTIINFAVQGWLVKQDANDEPASEALQRIRQARLNAGEKDFGTVPDDDVHFEIPNEWRWIKMGNLALSSDSGWSPQCESIPRKGTEWGVLKVSAVSWDTFDPEENKALPVGMAPRPECEVRDGDFLLSRANTEELVARSVVVTSTPPHLMMSDKIVRFVFPEEVEKQFINLANSTTFARAHYAKHASGTSSSMKNVGRGTMCNLPIPFPPLAEQRRIVAKVDELMALVDTLEAQLQEKSRLAEAFAQTCVASFTGTTQPKRPEKRKATEEAR